MAKKAFSILKSIQTIGENLQDEGRTRSAYQTDRTLSRHINALCKEMNCKPMFALHFAAIFYLTLDDENISLKNLAEFLKISMPEYKILYGELEQLLNEELIAMENSYRSRIEYSIPHDVRKKVFSEQIPVPRKLETDLYGLGEIADKCLDMLERNSGQYPYAMNFLHKLVDVNPALPVCSWIKTHKIDGADLIITFVLFTRALSGHSSHSVRDLSGYIARAYKERQTFRMNLMRGNQIHIRLNLVEWEGDDIQSREFLALTHKGKESFFGEEAANLMLDDFNSAVKTLKEPDKIMEKVLFYNVAEKTQITRLENILNEENYRQVCSRLTERRMNAGLCILFYGGPGTGKTESVMQLAKKSGRAVSQVDISSIRDKWVGESEKRAKAIFDDYRALCKNNRTTPILLLNEADAIITRRINVERSVDQMSNTIQNIFLDEMERFEGILIATTNLQNNFDAAFDRRFLFKIKFENPSAAIRACILRERIPSLTEDEARHLATNYELSGGQVENIARKVITETLISSIPPGMNEIEAFCEEETGFRWNRIGKSGIGFTIP